MNGNKSQQQSHKLKIEAVTVPTTALKITKEITNIKAIILFNPEIMSS